MDVFWKERLICRDRGVVGGHAKPCGLTDPLKTNTAISSPAAG
jgi:hypothetical protein